MGQKVFCFGAVVADLIAQEIPEIPGPGESSRTPAISLAVGGCAANAATGLARLGQQVALCGAVGDDDLGRFLRRELEQEGVALDHLSTEPGIPTGISFVINVQERDRRFISATGANDQAWPERFDLSLLEEAAAVSFHGFGLANRPNVADTEAILQAARAAGATTLLDVIVIPGEDLLVDLKRILPLVDVFLPNDDEAIRLTGATDPSQAASRLKSLGAGTVVVTCGDGGVVWQTETDSGTFEAFPVEEVDGTGCGDAFAAGWIDSHLRGGNLDDHLRTASAMGALASTAAGAIDGLPRRPELEQMLRTVSHTSRF